MVNINKTFKEVLSLQANLGASYSDMRQDVFSNECPISDTKGIANVFNVFHLDNDKTKRSQSGYREQTQSIFASVELGLKYLLFNIDMAYRLAFTIGRSEFCKKRFLLSFYWWFGDTIRTVAYA